LDLEEFVLNKTYISSDLPSNNYLKMTAALGASFTWRPEDIFNGSTSGSELKYGLLILNQPVLGDPQQVMSLWKRGILGNGW
jgi:hypothetical protein